MHGELNSARAMQLARAAARPLPVEKRDAYLTRIAGHLAQLGYRKIHDDDVDRAVRIALRGLLQGSAA